LQICFWVGWAQLKRKNRVVKKPSVRHQAGFN
jgi:hypothetical protein